MLIWEGGENERIDCAGKKSLLSLNHFCLERNMRFFYIRSILFSLDLPGQISDAFIVSS